MTVKVKQRVPDAKTLEQHEYIKYEIILLSTYRDGFGGNHVRLMNKNNQMTTVNLSYFDIEIVDC